MEKRVRVRGMTPGFIWQDKANEKFSRPRKYEKTAAYSS